MTELEIHEKHWLVWASRARAPVAPNGYASGFWSDDPDPDREPTIYDLYRITPFDVDVADSLGDGVEALGEVDSRKRHAVRARYLAPSDAVRNGELARRWQLSAARVSQLANEGQVWVESWVRDRWEVAA